MIGYTADSGLPLVSLHHGLCCACNGPSFTSAVHPHSSSPISSRSPGSWYPITYHWVRGSYHYQHYLILSSFILCSRCRCFLFGSPSPFELLPCRVLAPLLIALYIVRLCSSNLLENHNRLTPKQRKVLIYRFQPRELLVPRKYSGHGLYTLA